MSKHWKVNDGPNKIDSHSYTRLSCRHFQSAAHMPHRFCVDFFAVLKDVQHNYGRYEGRLDSLIG